MQLSGSRTEFLPDAPSDIKYSRSGGWFVSTKKAFALLLFVLGALVAVGLLVYYLAPRPVTRTAQPAVSSGPAPPQSSESQSTQSTLSGTVEQSSAQPTTEPPPEAQTNVRLSQNVKPHYYTVTLQPFIGESDSNFTFKGRVAILLHCQDKCESVTLHSKDLAIAWEEVTVSVATEDAAGNDTRFKKGKPKKYLGNSTKSDDVSLNATNEEGASLLKIIAKSEEPGNETITIQLDPAMESTVNYTLTIPFQGNLTDRLKGLYRSSYTDGTGTKKWLAVTQMEATYARRVFPCFDEPAMKAQFEIHLVRRDNLTAVSNMPLTGTEPVAGQPGWFMDSFEPTPMMSTYLVAVLVSDFGTANSTATDPKFSVLARKDQLKNADYALDIGPKILKYFSDYFGIAYPLPKMDMVAIPDFAAGAMENWGLVTYRENRVLFDKRSSQGAKQSIAGTIAHELAHMWFGNLVTMDWWADLWLNEGFATYVSKIGVDHVEPSWETLDQIVVRDVSHGMAIDSLQSTHAIYVPVSTPAQISEVFDSVSYNKGSCLIRMLNHSLTEEVFRAGLKDYLNTWMYMNANQDDLWTALTAATANHSGLLPEGASVKQVMDSWTRQEGFPVVTVSRDYSSGAMTLSQKRFLFDSTMDKASAQHWYIPVSYTTQEEMHTNDTRPRVWLTGDKEQRVEGVTKPGSNSWVLINLQQTGFYRVNYDDTNWRLISEHLKTAPIESLPAATRAQLIGDAFNLARAGLLGYDKALNLTLYLGRERRYVPWAAFFKGISFLDFMLKNTSAYPNLVKYLDNLVLPLESLMGMDVNPNDTHTERILRQSVMSKMLNAEVPRYEKYAQALFRQWLDNSTCIETTNPVTSDFRAAIYCAGVRNGSPKDWRKVWYRLDEEDDPVDRQYLLMSLSCTKEPFFINTLLDWSLDDTAGFRLQDLRAVWQMLDNNPMAIREAFRYIKDNWKDISKRYDGNEYILKGLISGVASGLTTDMELKELLKFQEDHKSTFARIARTMAQAVENVKLRVLWRQKYEAEVSQWLAMHAKTIA